MKKVEVKIIEVIKDNWHLRGPWEERISKRDVVRKTDRDVLEYELHDTVLIHLIPMGQTHKFITNMSQDMMVIDAQGWRTPTTLARVSAFLMYFCGITIWEDKPFRDAHTLKKTGNPRWYIAGPSFKKMEFRDGLRLPIKRW